MFKRERCTCSRNIESRGYHLLRILFIKIVTNFFQGYPGNPGEPGDPGHPGQIVSSMLTLKTSNILRLFILLFGCIFLKRLNNISVACSCKNIFSDCLCILELPIVLYVCFTTFFFFFFNNTRHFFRCAS